MLLPVAASQRGAICTPMTSTSNASSTAGAAMPPTAAPAPAATPDPVARPRTLLGLLVAQFLGAFNDNAFKILVTLLAIGVIAGANEVDKQRQTTLAFVVFTLPLMLGSLPAMALGDRVGKRDLIVGTKALELLLMALGTWALAVAPTGWAPLVVLAGMGLQSALFAPGKYGLLPEVLPHGQLAAANAKLEAASFLAIVLGTAAGGVLAAAVTGGIDGLAALAGHEWVAGALLTVLAAAGLLAALSLPRTPAAAAPEPFAAVLRASWAALRGDRALRLATLGSIAFWGLASLLGQDVLVYVKQVLGWSDTYAGVPFGVFAIGVGGGALLAGRLSKGKVEFGLIPLGALGLALGTAMLGVLVPGALGTLFWMAVLGVASGLVVVPLNAVVQWKAPASHRGAIIALVNCLSFAGVLAGNLGCLALAELGASSTGILVVAAALTLAATVWAVWLLPVALLRFVGVLATHTLYRVRVLGGPNVPQQGGALLVPNHVSFLDGLFLLAATDRPIRFVVEQHWYERPLLRPFLQALGAIPIAATGGPRVVLKALRDAGKAIDDGDLVCLFAEGEISRMGSVLPFRRGLQRIVKGRAAPIVPVHLDRVYGTLGSSRAGRVQWWPTRIPCPITVSFGGHLPNTTAPVDVRHAVDELAEAAARARADELEPLHAPFVRSVRRAPFARCLLDSQGKRLSRLQALAAAIVLARRLRDGWRDQQRVGVLLPPSIGAALTANAASLSGRAVVPLNYTVGAAAFASAIRQAKLRTIVSARAFLERVKLEIPPDVRVLALEDVMAGIGRGERLAAAARALLWPLRALERACGAKRAVRRGDEAAVLFSSGSTGEPKGVVLTHGNVHANCDAVLQLIPLDRSDCLVGVLPMFHSFGNMALWYALHGGAGVVFHANPLDAVAIGDMVARERATLMVATPTFLQLWMKRCEPGQFGSLRIVLTGAEKLTDELADAFADRFGIRPIQGYGTTECAPVIATCAPGYRAAGFYQAGTRAGSVGRPVPGVVVTIVDPDTREPVPVGQPGLVLVRGANVMRGYLDRDDLTAAVMHDGAYVTGDIGRLDEDGFLFLTDRLSRFSKIGGEMVPHGTVEEHLQAVSGAQERAFAVCGVPDARKGERLMVLTTLRADAVAEVVRGLATRGLPPLFVPRPDQFVTVDALPLLGTGKLDLRAVRERCLQEAGEA
jgi:acyl-[acyl-carrier-protein]-phospholipid O-acyltransferase/long-chain-fatty-acid--[acyl-carrier-protein] ligase